MTIPRKVISLGAKPLDHCGRNRDPLELDWIARVLRRPDPGLAAFDRYLPADRDAMLHLEARAAELAHLGGDVRHVIELGGLHEARLGVDQRNPENSVSRPELARPHPQRRLEHEPGAPIEELEEAAVEHDARRIAMP